jgi:SnoaL-like domain
MGFAQHRVNEMEEEMTLQMTRTDHKTEIRKLLDDWAKAARAGDLEGIMAAYAPDILSFDAIAQLQFKGAEAYRKHWEMCVEMCSGPMTFEIHDVGIEAATTSPSPTICCAAAARDRTARSRPGGCA